MAFKASESFERSPYDTPKLLANSITQVMAEIIAPSRKSLKSRSSCLRGGSEHLPAYHITLGGLGMGEACRRSVPSHTNDPMRQRRAP